jgi:hypothetical protein
LSIWYFGAFVVAVAGTWVIVAVVVAVVAETWAFFTSFKLVSPVAVLVAFVGQLSSLINIAFVVAVIVVEIGVLITVVVAVVAERAEMQLLGHNAARNLKLWLQGSHLGHDPCFERVHSLGCESARNLKLALPSIETESCS